MQVVGNIILALATFLFVLPLQLLIGDVGRKRHDGGAVWGASVELGPLWILLLVALLLVVARGGFDWLGLKRGPQYLVAFASGGALLGVTFFSFMGKFEHPNQLPWAARPFLGWALYLLPLLTIAFAAIELSPE